MNDIKVKDAAFSHGIHTQLNSDAGMRDHNAERSFRLGHQWTVDEINWDDAKKAFQNWQIKEYGYNTAIDCHSNEIFAFIKTQIEASWKQSPPKKR